MIPVKGGIERRSPVEDDKMSDTYDKNIDPSSFANHFTHKEAVYREATLTALVRVERVTIIEDGIQFQLSLLPGHCEFLSRDDYGQFGVYCTWDVFNISEDILSCTLA